MSSPGQRAAAVLALVLLAPHAGARDVQRPSAVAKRIDKPPVIDGRLDDEAWLAADPIGELTQVEPDCGAPPTERTEVRVLYDSEQLYIGVRCFDRDVDGIIGTQMERDAVLDPDDRVEIVIDTYLDRRNAYFFQMNPVGSKGDALITNNGQDFNKPWDAIWEGKSSIDAHGWSFEMALPFQTLNFAPHKSTWGLNVNRFIKRRNETDRWTATSADQEIFDIALAGNLTGLEGLEQGLGLDVVPFFVADWTNDRERDGGPDKDVHGEPGLDVFYKITPSLTASLTINTDFAETEADARQINLTRFPLFFPEKRDFFLQEAGIFEFADLGGDLIPFFSRRIGLDANGEEVPILAGAKVTGRQGDFNVGLIDVQTKDTDTAEGTNLFVGRIAKNVGEQSTVGGIFTHGNPTGTEDNALYGLDYNFRTSSFAGDKQLASSVWGLRTQTEGLSGDDFAYGAQVSYPNDRWSWRLSALEIQPNFDPRLGFVPRRDVRIYEAELFFSPRYDSAVRRVRHGGSSRAVTDLDGHLETFYNELIFAHLELDAGDEIAFYATPIYEDLPEDFEIADDVTIPEGEYGYWRFGIDAESALKRPVSAGLNVEYGEFFDGRRSDADSSLTWRASRFLTASIEHGYSDIDLQGGSFDTHVGRARTVVSFTPDISWSSFVQVDNATDSLGVNTRLRWIVKPGEELFLVFNETLEREDGSVHPVFQEVAFKISYTLRF
ncbi:MAG: DUF5916 domain-containing protein [Planctomycetota bacterium]